MCVCTRSCSHVCSCVLLCAAVLLLQNPKDKRKIIIDEKLGTLFTTPLTMFSINKQLTKHVISACESALDPADHRT